MRAVRWLAVGPGTRGRGMAGNGAAHLVTMMPMMVMMVMMLMRMSESGMIVSDVQFEENAHGGSSALGRLIAVVAVVTVMILFNIVRNVRVLRQEGRQQFVCWRISQHQYWQRVPGGDSQERQEEDRGLGSAAPSEAGSH